MAAARSSHPRSQAFSHRAAVKHLPGARAEVKSFLSPWTSQSGRGRLINTAPAGIVREPWQDAEEEQWRGGGRARFCVRAAARKGSRTLSHLPDAEWHLCAQPVDTVRRVGGGHRLKVTCKRRGRRMWVCGPTGGPGHGFPTRRAWGGTETHGVSRREPGEGRGPRTGARRLGAGQGDSDTQPGATEGRSLSPG